MYHGEAGAKASESRLVQFDGGGEDAQGRHLYCRGRGGRATHASMNLLELMQICRPSSSLEWLNDQPAIGYTRRFCAIPDQSSSPGSLEGTRLHGDIDVDA